MDTSEVRTTPFQVGKSFLIAQYLIMHILLLKCLESLKPAFGYQLTNFLTQVSFKVGFECRRCVSFVSINPEKAVMEQAVYGKTQKNQMNAV